MVKILALAGSLRSKSYNRRVLKIAVEGARAAGSDVDILDLRDYPLPLFNADDVEKNGFDPTALKLQELLVNYHGLLIAPPNTTARFPADLRTRSIGHREKARASA